jgi:hypothetical protein
LSLSNHILSLEGDVVRSRGKKRRCRRLATGRNKAFTVHPQGVISAPSVGTETAPMVRIMLRRMRSIRIKRVRRDPLQALLTFMTGDHDA